MAQRRVKLLGRRGRLVEALQILRRHRRRDNLASIEAIGIRVRDAEPRDCAVIAEMANDLSRTTGGRDGGMTAQRVERDLMNGEGLGLIVADLDGSVAGYALYTTAYDTAHGARGLYLSDLFVDCDARRHSVGQSLMAELAWRCRDEGGSFIWWIVMPGNPDAESFYASLGADVDPPKAMAVHGRAFQSLIQRRERR